MTRDTIGKISSDLIQKTPDTRSPIEQMEENLTDYEKNVWECVTRHKLLFPANFYVIVETKTEKLMQNVIRNYFFARQTCPTPNYDQTLYYYHKDTDTVDFIWVIPSREACWHMKQNAIQVDRSERELLKFVLDFDDGTLFKKCKLLNGEKEFSPELEV